MVELHLLQLFKLNKKFYTCQPKSMQWNISSYKSTLESETFSYQKQEEQESKYVITLDKITDQGRLSQSEEALDMMEPRKGQRDPVGHLPCTFSLGEEVSWIKISL